MNIPKLLLSAVCTLAAASAFADAGVIKDSSIVDRGPINASNNQISLQAISTKVDYTETGDGNIIPAGTLDTERNNVGGYAVSLSLMNKMIWNNDYIRLQYSHNIGHTAYVGQSLFGGGGYGSLTGTSSASLRDLSLRYGTGFSLGNSAMVTPFLEVGEHKWDRGANAGENYSNDYYGIGVLGQYSPMRNLVLSIDALVGRTKNARVDVSPFYFYDSGNNLHLFSGGSLGLGGALLQQYGVSADYAVTKGFHVNIGVDYTEFKYGISAVNIDPDPYIGGWLEPDSKTKYTTYSFGVGYAF